MSDAPPRVSVGVPVYNGEAFLRPQLDSLLNQTLRDIEIVVSDNASTDGTASICKEYAARDPRLRYYSERENRGASYNFTRVFQLARGRYFKWASANDLHAPTYLERCAEVLDRSPDVVLCYAKTRMIDVDGRVLRDFEDRLDLPWPDPVVRFREYLRRVRLCNALYGVIRPEVLRRTVQIAPYPGSDIVLLGELALHGKFYEVPEYLFFRREEPAAMDRNRSTEELQSFYAPRTRGKPFLRTWRHQSEYLAAIMRAPLQAFDKVRLTGIVGRMCVSRRDDLMREAWGALRSLAPGDAGGSARRRAR